MSYLSNDALIESADQLIRDKFYNGKELSPIVKSSSLYRNRLYQAIKDIKVFLKSIQEYNSLYSVS